MADMSGDLWNAVDRSQDGHPMSKYLRRRAETMLGDYEIPVGDCVSETITRCFESANDNEELLSHLQYAAHELTKAATAVRKVLLEVE